MEEQEEPLQWFAMRALYRNELRIKGLLDEKGFQTFVPMTTVHKREKNRVRHITRPAVAGLLFVRTTKSEIHAFKQREEKLQYICFQSKTEKKGTPIIVPDQQMDDFIRLCTEADNPQFLDPALDLLTPGDQVLVTNGIFAGMTGTLQRVKGKRARQFVIQIPRLLSISVEIQAKDLEVIKSTTTNNQNDTHK